MRVATIMVLALAASLGGIGAAQAVCAGAASPAALQAFEKDPLAWTQANTGKPDVGDQVLALSAAAVSGGDPGFGAAFTTLLQNASGDDGTAIGKSLAGLVGTCTDPRDPSDKADKKYIALSIVSNLPVNAAANAAYGARSGQPTASVGGPGGGGAGGGAAGGSTGGAGGGGGGEGSGLGIGPIGGATPTGGSNTGGGSQTGGTTATATAQRTSPTLSAAALGSEAVSTASVR